MVIHHFRVSCFMRSHCGLLSHLFLFHNTFPLFCIPRTALNNPLSQCVDALACSFYERLRLSSIKSSWRSRRIREWMVRCECLRCPCAESRSTAEMVLGSPTGSMDCQRNEASSMLSRYSEESQTVPNTVKIGTFVLAALVSHFSSRISLFSTDVQKSQSYGSRAAP